MKKTIFYAALLLVALTLSGCGVLKDTAIAVVTNDQSDPLVHAVEGQAQLAKDDAVRALSDVRAELALARADFDKRLKTAREGLVTVTSSRMQTQSAITDTLREIADLTEVAVAQAESIKANDGKVRLEELEKTARQIENAKRKLQDLQSTLTDLQSREARLLGEYQSLSEKATLIESEIESIERKYAAALAISQIGGNLSTGDDPDYRDDINRAKQLLSQLDAKIQAQDTVNQHSERSIIDRQDIAKAESLVRGLLAAGGVTSTHGLTATTIITQ